MSSNNAYSDLIDSIWDSDEYSYKAKALASERVLLASVIEAADIQP